MANEIKVCEDSQNCISSKDSREKFNISPIPYEENISKKLKKIISKMSRSEFVKEEDGYMHFEFTSLIMRFTDDVEFLIDKKNKVVHVRSASRIGYSDWDVNRNRINEIKIALLKNKLYID